MRITDDPFPVYRNRSFAIDAAGRLGLPARCVFAALWLAVSDNMVRHAGDRWNHSIHYYPLLLEAVPEHAHSALDIGCGEGMFTRKLSEFIPTVVGIDTDQASIDQAREQAHGTDAKYIVEDFLNHPFEDQSFDVIASIATLHHMDDPRAALSRMRTLLRPGGVIAILGLAASSPRRDWAFEIAGSVAHKALLRTRTYWEHPSPKVFTAPSYPQMRQIAADVLPGCRFRRHLLWRYSLIWTKAA
jgi:SAM-dependent methyltransferase